MGKGSHTTTVNKTNDSYLDKQSYNEASTRTDVNYNLDQETNNHQTGTRYTNGRDALNDVINTGNVVFELKLQNLY